MECDRDGASYDEERPPLCLNPRSVDYCIQWGFPKSNCCGGCTNFATGIKLEIDERCHNEAMAMALDKRKETHQSGKYQCLQLWLQPVDGIRFVKDKMMKIWQCNYINDVHKRNTDRLQQSTVVEAAAAPVANVDVAPDGNVVAAPDGNVTYG